MLDITLNINSQHCKTIMAKTKINLQHDSSIGNNRVLECRGVDVSIVDRHGSSNGNVLFVVMTKGFSYEARNEALPCEWKTSKRWSDKSAN